MKRVIGYRIAVSKDESRVLIVARSPRDPNYPVRPLPELPEGFKLTRHRPLCAIDPKLTEFTHATAVSAVVDTNSGEFLLTGLSTMFMDVIELDHYLQKEQS